MEYLYFIVYLLEEEMIIDELLLDIFAHAIERVEMTLEVSLEGVQCSNNLIHDL